MISSAIPPSRALDCLEAALLNPTPHSRDAFPPKYGRACTSKVLAPCRAAAIAAGIPPGPPPTTTTSYSPKYFGVKSMFLNFARSKIYSSVGRFGTKSISSVMRIAAALPK